MDKLKQWLHKEQVWGFFAGVAVMAVIALAFFFPDNFEGNSLRQYDMQQGAANGQESVEFYEATGEKALWTNSLFGGMPTFQISPSYPSNALFTWLNTLYGLGLPSPSNLLFMMMFGFFILLMAMRLRWHYALIGAIAWGFSSYFVIIIGAGHIWKFVTLSYIPPTIAGLVLCYRGRYIAGAAMTSIFAMLQLNANHPQMSYYFAFVMVALVIAWLIDAIRQKQIKRWLIASAVTLAAGGLAIGSNLPSIYHTYEYAKETKRSQSELTPLPSASKASTDRPTGGMARADILGWSYGQSETFSLLIPNIKGGASAKPMGGNMVFMGLDQLEEAKNIPCPYLGQMPQYFNGTEGTNGPVYVGAIIFALFIVGCIVVKGPVKWALLFSTLLSIMLAWGINFEWLSDLMIYNFPLYNKFRAVESILVIAEFCMPLLAILALKELFTCENPLKKHSKALYIGLGACAAVCLLAIVAPSVFGEAISDGEREAVNGIIANISQSDMPEQQKAAYIQQYSLSNPNNGAAIESLRYGMVSSDALRSFMFIAFAACVMIFCFRGKIKKSYALVAIGTLSLLDLYLVDKRYVDGDSFVAVAQDAPNFTPDAIDEYILQDKETYRVMDIPGFSTPNRSYFHHCIGGYHAAKLMRFEDLIQRRIMPVIQYGYLPEMRNDSIISMYSPEEQKMLSNIIASYRVLDMLNTRYIITGDKDYPLEINDHALGNAWLVGNLIYVDNADTEMTALGHINPATEAVADKKFTEMLGNINATIAPSDRITLTSYTPNTLTYTSESSVDALGVFSEVYFPWGWKATIDGNEVELGRVNYILRALPVPAGKHEIVMTFDPESLQITGTIAYASVSLIYLLVLLAIFVEFRRRNGSEQV